MANSETMKTTLICIAVAAAVALAAWGVINMLQCLAWMIENNPVALVAIGIGVLLGAACATPR